MEIGANWREIQNERRDASGCPLTDFQRKGNSCYGFIEGDESKMEELLDNYMSLTSTCFVRSQCHDKNKGHKTIFFYKSRKQII